MTRVKMIGAEALEKLDRRFMSFLCLHRAEVIKTVVSYARNMTSEEIFMLALKELGPVHSIGFAHAGFSKQTGERRWSITTPLLSEPESPSAAAAIVAFLCSWLYWNGESDFSAIAIDAQLRDARFWAVADDDVRCQLGQQARLPLAPGRA